MLNMSCILPYACTVPKNQLSCPGGNVSLGLSQLCDGTVSCPNGEDEGNTGELSCM